MGNTALRGRPRLDIDMREILETIRKQDKGHIMPAAQELTERGLRCSDRYIRARLTAAGLTLQDVLDAPDVESLLAADGCGLK